MSFAVTKLNNEVVTVIPSKTPKDTRPVKGWKLFPEMNANIFACAKKKSGKTLTIRHILRKCCGKDTKIIVFCATLYKDPSWIAIKEWAEEKGLVFIGHESLKDDDGVDQLDLLIKELQAKVKVIPATGMPVARRNQSSIATLRTKSQRKKKSTKARNTSSFWMI